MLDYEVKCVLCSLLNYTLPLLKDPNQTKTGLWELTEALKRRMFALLNVELETNVSCIKQETPFRLFLRGSILLACIYF